MVTHKKSRLLLGAHMSISGGFETAIARGTSIGCTTIQVFTKSNRQWHAKPIDPEEAELFRTAVKESDIDPIVAHATYLINLGASDAAIAKKSVKAVLDELERCNLLGIPYLVLHPGSHNNTNEEECLARIAENLDTIFETDTGKTKILLEIMAGQGSSVCYSFEHLATIRKLSHHKHRLGVCFDTCHAFAAGYDFTTPHGYKAMWDEFESVIGLEHLLAMHINDSKKELGSHVDRHEDVGKGEIGLEAFEMLFNDHRFFDIPKILETPENKEEKDSLKDYARNMRTIKNLLSEATKKKLDVQE
jgi:deoxyribonuclease-4